jgi:hypothetical protein
MPPIVFDLIRWFTAFAMAVSVLSGLIIASLFLIRRTQPNRWANWLFAGLLTAFALTLLDRLLNFTFFTQRHPSVFFLPIYLSFALAPLLFFYVKSRLYPQFHMYRRDFKHFILPTVQISLLLMMMFQSAEQKAHFQTHFFSPFYGNFEKGVFILQLFLYLYFAYRFIRHERFQLMKKSQKPTFNRRQVLVVGWLKRMVKVLFILFGVHASFILTDYFSYRLFEINLQSKIIFPAVYELSFAAMLAWLCLNALFALQRRL